MKSNSGNDGSYTLTVSFALGTNPDIDTVNVNNRVQTALAQLPTEVQRAGRDGAASDPRRSWSSSQFYSEGGKQDPLFISNYVTINVLDAIVARARRRPGAAVRRARLLDAHLVRHASGWSQLNLAPSDIIAAIQSAERAGARSAASAPGRSTDDTQFQINVQTQGRLTTPEQFGDIVLRANPDGSVLRVARRRARRTRRREHGHREPAERQAGGHRSASISPPAPTRCRPRRACRRRWTSWRRASPTGLKARVVLRQLHDFVSDTITRGDEDAGRGLRAGRARGVPVPRQHARHHHPDGRGAGQPDRHLRGAAGARLSRPTRSRCWRWCWRSASSSTTPSWWSRTSSG